VGDIEDLGLPDNSFEAVICVFGIFFAQDIPKLSERYQMKRIKTPLTIKAITQSRSVLNHARLSKVSPNFS
jgi:hypothetical protein